MAGSKRTYSDFVEYYSNLWLEECIQQNNVANEHELYITTLCDNKNIEDKKDERL
tara:strand:+ start:40 stop:204 length:165 start_codon:yes stop_codon:yes gene_type:complete